MFKFLKSATSKVVLGAITLLPALAMAEEKAVDYTALTSKIDFSGAITAVLSVIGIIIGALVAWKGGQWIIKAVRGA
ncbi:major capsid protein [Aggregatibacter actinomycetemcomitans]|uniref:major capsid protein n=1 Tax=Aggregatibacter actinomycetemcomitans TaxID=714 RepID=UPI00197B23C4|nr:major capsid protein [Aggregatibacter actinomycetemcomitans]MBN6078538.1 hypothetical protein [Aggregatibacter actinomycetemcomitans]